MRLISKLEEIFKVKDLRHRILVTFLFVLVYRFGSFVVLPGIDTGSLSSLKDQTAEGLMGLLDMFSGGAFSNASIFALGIMPYISASIVVQLLTIAVPSFQKMQKDGDSGRKKMIQITRYLTVAILLLQGPSYLINLAYQLREVGSALPTGWWFRVYATIILCSGSMFVMWLGERITDKGVGNGISFIILVGIIARFPHALVGEFNSCLNETGGLIKLILELIGLFAVSCAAILLVQGVRKVPVQYARQMAAGQRVGGARQYIPLKVNAANVMPIIFAQAIMFIPLALMPVLGNGDGSGSFFSMWRDNNSLVYNLIFATLIIVFTYFYVAIIINPTQMAEDM
ncbi:MAG: preprotein translocase subunit SecY, partial [Paludibacteraceae bacterium]|nr:preprotein translocase subunit SecY [Paludibacteraceae bacterium]